MYVLVRLPYRYYHTGTAITGLPYYNVVKTVIIFIVLLKISCYGNGQADVSE